MPKTTANRTPYTRGFGICLFFIELRCLAKFRSRYAEPKDEDTVSFPLKTTITPVLAVSRREAWFSGRTTSQLSFLSRRVVVCSVTLRGVAARSSVLNSDCEGWI